MKKNNIIAVLTLLLGLLLKTQAQQTVFNVPSGDVLDKGKVYGELDVPFKLNKGRTTWCKDSLLLCRAWLSAQAVALKLV
jgi:hypothetical protein